MKLSAKIELKTNHHTREKYTDDNSLVNYFKELLWRGRERVIEETFPAQELLSKISVALKNSGVDDLVRISYDDNDFYLDKNKIPHDLDGEIAKFSELLHNSFERFYNEITVIIESKWQQIDFYIEVVLYRVHAIGEWPIKIEISALPEHSGVAGVADNFNLFVNRVSQNIQKYIDVEDISLSFIKKGIKSPLVEKKQESKDSPSSIIEECDLFPLYNVQLGKTTIEELQKMGVKAKDLDENKKPYKYYTVKDVRFWHDKKRATHMYMTYTDPMPEKWVNCGFDWDLSYNDWKKLFKKLGFHISNVIKTQNVWYSGKRTLKAQFNATKKVSSDLILTFEIYFNYSQKTSLKSKGTIYSLRVRGE